MTISEEDLMLLMTKRDERLAYGGLKRAAEMAARLYGCEWARKYPVTSEACAIKNKLRRLVVANIPSNHSNKDVVWQRFRKYALMNLSAIKA